MKDHLILNVDNLLIPEPVEATEVAKYLYYGEVSVTPLSTAHSFFPAWESMGAEKEPLIQTVECRICQEEDNTNNLESPCACTGSLTHAHQVCVQRWCDEKGDLTCEICREPYKHGYTALPRAHPDETTIDISGGWTITGTSFDLRDPRILAMAQNHIMEADYDDYSATYASTAAFCRSVALVLMALLLLRHTLMLADEDEDDTSAMFSLFLLRAAGFLLPFYIMAWAINIIQRRRQRQLLGRGWQPVIKLKRRRFFRSRELKEMQNPSTCLVWVSQGSCQRYRFADTRWSAPGQDALRGWPEMDVLDFPCITEVCNIIRSAYFVR